MFIFYVIIFCIYILFQHILCFIIVFFCKNIKNILHNIVYTHVNKHHSIINSLITFSIYISSATHSVIVDNLVFDFFVCVFLRLLSSTGF